MKQRIQTVGWLTALLALTLLWVSPAMAKRYDLFIGATQVTDDNCGDLRGIEGVTVASGGEFNYNPSTKTLKMKDVTVSPWHASPISYDVKGLTIAVSGVNRLISNGGGAAIYANNSIFIEGDGSLYCSGGNSYWPAVSLDEKTTLTISDITFSVSNGIRGERGKKDQKLSLRM